MTYNVDVCEASGAPEWDDFLGATPGGHHAQTSLWARVKAELGWRGTRLIARQSGAIVGGAQLLTRTLPCAGGSIGYISKGPLFALNDSLLCAELLQALRQLMRQQRLQAVVLQPPNNGNRIASQLPQWGFYRSWLRAAQPTATLMLDLAQSPETLWQQMRKKTRYGVRRSHRDGVVVREGGQADLAVFYRLLATTGERHGFEPYPQSYYAKMWQEFAPQGYVKLFLAEYAGEAVSAHMVMFYGDTATAKYGGWSGRHGVHHPNEALEWHTIRWAQTHGYRYYDFEGIAPEAAQALLQHAPLPETLRLTPTSYKAGFGGQVVLYPDTYIAIKNPLLRWSYARVIPCLEKQRWFHDLIHRVRTRP